MRFGDRPFTFGLQASADAVGPTTPGREAPPALGVAAAREPLGCRPSLRCGRGGESTAERRIGAATVGRHPRGLVVGNISDRGRVWVERHSADRRRGPRSARGVEALAQSRARPSENHVGSSSGAVSEAVRDAPEASSASRSVRPMSCRTVHQRGVGMFRDHGRSLREAVRRGDQVWR